MSVMRRWLAIAVPFLVAAAVLRPVAAWGDPPAGKKKQAVDALVLAKDMTRSVAFIAKSAREVKEGKADPKTAHAKPFWTELKRMDKQVDAIAKGFKGHDASAFHAIGEAGEALAALKVAWHRTGVADPHVKEGIATLSHAYNSLRKHYGPEAARVKKGGSLSEKEQKRFAAVKEKQAKLAAGWKTLRDQAAAKGHKRVVAELDHLLAEATLVAKAEITVEAYVEVFERVDTIEGEWEAYSYDVPTDLHEEWHTTETLTTTTFESFDAVYVEEIDEVGAGDWAALDADVEVSAEVDYDVEITDEEVAAEDDFIDDVHEETHEEYDTETAEEPEPEEVEPEEFDDSGGDDGGEPDDGD